MVKILMVGLGGFLGATARYLLCGAVQKLHGGTFPLGTLTVNIIGCLIIGAGVALIENREFFGGHARLLLIIGLLGSFTTFSAFGHETVELMRSGAMHWALCNAAGNVLLGTGAVILGRFAVETLIV